jgi:hypothetical protein
MNKLINEDIGIEGDWDSHDTLLYNIKMYNYLNNLRHNHIDSPQTYKAMRSHKNTIDNIDKTKNYVCSRNQNKDAGDCRFKYCNYKADTREELLAHEQTCFNIKETLLDKPIKFLECNFCGKKFYDKGQKLKPIYALNHHKKTCKNSLKKRRIAFIKKFLIDINDIDLNELFIICKSKTINAQSDLESNENINLINSLQAKAESEVEQSEVEQPLRPLSADSNISTSSELSDWEFDHKIYGVDNKNRVYDNMDNCIGKRIKDDFSNEYKIDYC